MPSEVAKDVFEEAERRELHDPSGPQMHHRREGRFNEMAGGLMILDDQANVMWSYRCTWMGDYPRQSYLRAKVIECRDALMAKRMEAEEARALMVRVDPDQQSDEQKVPT